MDVFESMRTFVRVVERGSFSAVARELNIGQPAVSKQIVALEQYLGGALLTRSTRLLVLTDQGERFYADCQAIIARLEAATLGFATGQEQVTGRLRITAPVSYGRLRIAPLLGVFLQRYPNVQIDLRLSDQMEDVVKEDIDLAIRIGRIKNEGLVAIPLGITERRVYAATAYLERHGTPISPEQLQTHNCIGFTLLDNYDIWHFTRDTQNFDIKIKGNVTSNSSEGIRELVLSGVGMSLSPEWLFAGDIENRRVTTVLDDYNAIALPVNAVLRQERRRSARTMAFVHFLQQALLSEQRDPC